MHSQPPPPRCARFVTSLAGLCGATATARSPRTPRAQVKIITAVPMLVTTRSGSGKITKSTPTTQTMAMLTPLEARVIKDKKAAAGALSASAPCGAQTRPPHMRPPVRLGCVPTSTVAPDEQRNAQHQRPQRDACHLVAGQVTTDRWRGVLQAGGQSDQGTDVAGVPIWTTARPIRQSSLRPPACRRVTCAPRRCRPRRTAGCRRRRCQQPS
jgi:hypothetical protein